MHENMTGMRRVRSLTEPLQTVALNTAVEARTLQALSPRQAADTTEVDEGV